MTAVLTELRKIPAFARRDFFVAWSYRTAFMGDLVSLATQIITFYFISLMVDPSVIPTFGGREISYMGFVSIGIAIGAFLQVGMSQISTAIRSEQMMGTLDSLWMTPTRMPTLQVGLAAYNIVYVPIRTTIFLAAFAIIFDITIFATGIVPTLAVLLLFIPFIWGLGMTTGAVIFTIRRGGGLLGLTSLALNLTSGAYFPLTLFPDWVQQMSTANPIAIMFEVARETLLGGAGWEVVTPHLPLLAISAVVSIVIGTVTTRLALERERRLGTLGMY